MTSFLCQQIFFLKNIKYLQGFLANLSRFNNVGLITSIIPKYRVGPWLYPITTKITLLSQYYIAILPIELKKVK